MTSPSESTTTLEDSIDVNSPEFYNLLNDEIENDMARLKKSLEIMKRLRLSAAEMEIETAALFHAELWYNIEEFNIEVKKSEEDQQQEITPTQIDLMSDETDAEPNESDTTSS